MRGITLGVFSAQPIYDVDFQTNVLDVAQTNSIAVPPLGVRWRLNKLMVDMKNIGFYQIQDTLANFALGITGFEQFRMIDWKKTGNIYTPYGGLIYTPEGIEGNGIDAYVDTNFDPSISMVNYSLNNASRSVVISKTVDNLNYVISTGSGSVGYWSNREANTGTNRINQELISSTTTNLSGTGYKHISRNVNTGFEAVNMSDLTYATANSTIVDAGNIRLLASTTVRSEIGISIFSSGASIGYGISQSFRTIYNQFLSDSGLSPIA